MSSYIQNLLKTRGWREVEKIMEQTISDLNSEYVDEFLDANEYKLVSMANKKAVIHIEAMLKDIRLKGQDTTPKNISYK